MGDAETENAWRLHERIVHAVAKELALTHATGALRDLSVPWVRMPESDVHLRRRPDGARVDEARRHLLLVEVDISTSSYQRAWSYAVAAALVPEWTVELLIVNQHARYPLPLDIEKGFV